MYSSIWAGGEAEGQGVIAYAKANPGKLSYGRAGVSVIQDLTGELLKSLTETPDAVQSALSRHGAGDRAPFVQALAESSNAVCVSFRRPGI
jgi:hypothetical protein